MIEEALLGSSTCPLQWCNWNTNLVTKDLSKCNNLANYRHSN